MSWPSSSPMPSSAPTTSPAAAIRRHTPDDSPTRSKSSASRSRSHPRPPDPADPPPRPSPGTARCPGTVILVSEAGDLLGQTRLAVGGLVLVDDALAGGLVELLGGDLESGGRGGGVPGLGGGAGAPGGRLPRGLDRNVALTRLLVGPDALDLGLDVRHA